MDIGALFESLNKISIDEAVKETIEYTIPELIDLQTEQMQKGIKSDGERIEDKKGVYYPYSTPYAKKKSAMGLQTKVVDLFVTGDFYHNETAQFSGDSIIFNNIDEKNAKLERQYGKEIHGMAPETIQKYVEDTFSSVFKDKLKKQSGIDFGS